MSAKLPLPLKLPPDVWSWIRHEAARRRMPVGNYTLELIRRGILDEKLEEKIKRVDAAASLDGRLRAIFREIVTLRHLSQGKHGLPEFLSNADEIHKAVEAEVRQRWPEE